MLVLSRWAGEGIWLIRPDGKRICIWVRSASSNWIVLDVEGENRALEAAQCTWVWDDEFKTYFRILEAGSNRARLCIDAPSSVTILRSELCDKDGIPLREKSGAMVIGPGRVPG